MGHRTVFGASLALTLTQPQLPANEAGRRVPPPSPAPAQSRVLGSGAQGWEWGRARGPTGQSRRGHLQTLVTLTRIHLPSEPQFPLL